MKVYINDKNGKRKLIDAELIKDKKTTVLVKLPDGNVIVRKKKRDLPKKEEVK